MWNRSGLVIGLVLIAAPAQADEPINLNDIPSDLTIPAVTDDEPAAGRRFRMTLRDYAGWNLAHVVYLPVDWKEGETYPVIVEYPGNGRYVNKYGDKSTGRVDDCKLGYGLSSGRKFIWVCLPFVDPQSKSHALNWWGDPDATAAYFRSAVAQVCNELGGDPKSVILCGFSRGALACSYIGLRNDETAKLWRAMIAHSHFDGVRKWEYPESDAKSARKRLRRLGDRPIYVTQEHSVADIEAFLQGTDLNATVRAIPYPNHTAEWVLKDIPERAELRAWLSKVIND